MSSNYLETFFAEKKIEPTVYNVEAIDGTLNIIETEVVIEALLRTKGAERAKAEEIIRKIDFFNGDLHHFFEHIAKSLARPLFA